MADCDLCCFNWHDEKVECNRIWIKNWRLNLCLQTTISRISLSLFFLFSFNFCSSFQLISFPTLSLSLSPPLILVPLSCWSTSLLFLSHFHSLSLLIFPLSFLLLLPVDLLYYSLSLSLSLSLIIFPLSFLFPTPLMSFSTLSLFLFCSSFLLVFFPTLSFLSLSPLSLSLSLSLSLFSPSFLDPSCCHYFSSTFVFPLSLLVFPFIGCPMCSSTASFTHRLFLCLLHLENFFLWMESLPQLLFFSFHSFMSHLLSFSLTNSLSLSLFPFLFLTLSVSSLSQSFISFPSSLSLSLSLSYTLSFLPLFPPFWWRGECLNTFLSFLFFYRSFLNPSYSNPLFPSSFRPLSVALTYLFPASPPPYPPP